MSLFNRAKARFREEIPAEGTQELVNPGRGWYQVYGFDAGVEPDWEELRWCIKPEEALALLMLDIGAFRQEPLSGEALGRIARILEFFGSFGKKLIVRVVYDREGKGLEREPSALSMIQTHMRQLGPVLLEHKELIFTLQGLLIGSWGEMHTSRYLAPPQLRLLADTLWESVEGSCFLAVRRPVQWRQLQGDKEPERSKRIGLYNDGIFGSESDLGTYGEASGDWQQAWSRDQELSFQEKICRDVPNGGEAVGSDAPEDVKARDVVTDLRRMRVSYLNGVYDPARLEKWKKEVWTGRGPFCGKSLYDYIGAHLGYRLVVRKAQLCGGGGSRLRVTVENTGFGGILEDVAAELAVEGDNGRTRLSPSSLTGDFSPGRTVLDFELEETWEGCFRVYLGLVTAGAGQRILFANEEGRIPSGKEAAGQYVLLGELSCRKNCGAGRA